MFVDVFESLGLLGDHKTAFKALSPRTGCQQNLELTSTSALYSNSLLTERLCAPSTCTLLVPFGNDVAPTRNVLTCCIIDFLPVDAWPGKSPNVPCDHACTWSTFNAIRCLRTSNIPMR